MRFSISFFSRLCVRFSFSHISVKIFKNRPSKKAVFHKFYLFHSLTLRSRNTYIYVFRAFFAFLQILTNFLLVLEASSKFISFQIKFWVKGVRFLVFICTRKLPAFVQIFQTEERARANTVPICFCVKSLFYMAVLPWES